MGSWSDRAKQVIHEVHRSLPDTATLAERQKAVDDAYPFGERAHFPYKAWLQARREYLCRYGYRTKGPAGAETPMERMMRRAGASHV